MNDVYFVMLALPNGNSVPMMNGDKMAFYEDLEGAKEAALNTPLGSECGYEIFELGGGISG